VYTFPQISFTGVTVDTNFLSAVPYVDIYFYLFVVFLIKMYNFCCLHYNERIKRKTGVTFSVNEYEKLQIIRYSLYFSVSKE
jgi:hypothetical protein